VGDPWQPFLMPVDNGLNRSVLLGNDSFSDGKCNISIVYQKGFSDVSKKIMGFKKRQVIFSLFVTLLSQALRTKRKNYC
jgi:hypothetical protein